MVDMPNSAETGDPILGAKPTEAMTRGRQGTFEP